MYKIINATNILHVQSGAVFPIPPVESYGYEYQRWVDAGNTPEPAPAAPPPPVPIEVTQRQTRMALHSLGLLATVEAAINALPDPPRTEARIAWDFSNTVQRGNPFVSQIAGLLGFTSAQLDDLFILAATL